MAGVREVMRPRVPGARAREGVAWLAVPRDLGEEEEEEEEEEEDALPEPPASSPPFASLFSRSSLALVSSHRIALPTCRARCSKLCACMQGQATPTPEELAGRLRAFNGSHRIRRTHRAWVGAHGLVPSLQFAVQCSLTPFFGRSVRPRRRRRRQPPLQ